MTDLLSNTTGPLDEAITTFNDLERFIEANAILSTIHDRKIYRLLIPITEKEYKNLQSLAIYILINYRLDIFAAVRLIVLKKSHKKAILVFEESDKTFTEILREEILFCKR